MARDSHHPRKRRLLRVVVGLMAFVVALVSAAVAVAFHGGSHTGNWKTWNLATGPLNGTDPRETVDDPQGLTNQSGILGPANVTAMSTNVPNRPTLLYWNPATNQFRKYFFADGGTAIAIDVNRSTTTSSGPPNFGGGDVWGTVFGNPFISPYMNFRGSNQFRTWNVGATQATGIRVNPANGKVYFGDFGSGRIFELTPPSSFRIWTIGSKPVNLVIDPLGIVYATAVTGGGHPDQIVRLDPTTNSVTRWNVPGGGFSGAANVGVPNFISLDDEGQVWFTETGSNEIGRLYPALNLFEEYSKPGIGAPNAIASSGIGPALQSVFTEASGDQVSVLTRIAASPTPTAVVPSMAMVTPTPQTVIPGTRTPPAVTAMITPVTSNTTSTDPSGIDRFPIPAGTDMPTGMSRVAFPQTVFGSLSTSRHVFQFVGSVVVSEEEGKVTGGGYYAVTGGAATFGFNVQRKDGDGPVTGQLEYQNHATGENVHSVAFDSLVVSDSDNDGENDTAVFSGTCTNNMVPCTFQVQVEDKGEPGVGQDTFRMSGIVITPTSGTLLGGNIQIHKSKS